MPATAGRVRMPANNRVHSSAALQTHGIWQSAIGYDPYAPNKDDSKNSAQPKASSNETDADNPYNSYQGLLALARITNTNVDDARGACKKCGRVGHLTFQCRNFLSAKEKDPEAIQAAVLSELDKIKGKVGKGSGKGKGEIEDGSDEEEEESDSSDSDADSEMERIIAARFGKKVNDKGRSSRKKKRDDSDENVSDSDMDAGKRKKRGRSKKRSGKRGHCDSEDEDEGKRKRREKRRNRDESSDEENERRRRRRKYKKEKRRIRGHRHADDSDSSTSEDSGGKYERKKSRRSVTPSDFVASGSDDSRVRRAAKRSTRKSRKRRHRDYE